VDGGQVQMRTLKQLLIAGLLCGLPLSARAECDCAKTSARASFKCHDAVFIGTTTEIAGLRFASVTVNEVFKGRVQHDVVVAGVEGDCGYVQLDPNRQYLFHAVRDGEASDDLFEVWTITICGLPLPADEPRGALRIAQLRRRAWWWRLPLSGWCLYR
jgi:hypothetical protein